MKHSDWPPSAKAAFKKLEQLVEAAKKKKLSDAQKQAIAIGLANCPGSELLKKHQDPPRISFFIFSQLIPVGVMNVNCGMSYMAKPAGMWGALCLDQALEAATRSIAAAEGNENNCKPIFLRVDFVLPNPP